MPDVQALEAGAVEVRAARSLNQSPEYPEVEGTAAVAVAGLEEVPAG